MRVLAIDVGRRRVGLAISDPTRTLARPLTTITVDAGGAVDRIAREVTTLSREEDGVDLIVVGLPRSLDGQATPQTHEVEAFVSALRMQTSITIVTADERLTSREAESRLAINEKDWRKRKLRLDAAAAAVILQDYLDRGPV